MAAERTPMDEPRPIPADWLNLREDADSRARASTREPVERLLTRRPPEVIVDVGAGTGTGARWLARSLRGDEAWLLLDHDPALLTLATARLRRAGVSGPISEVLDDLARLGPILDGATAEGASPLVITSALLDLLTEPQLAGLLDDVAVRGVPLIAALTVTGGMTVGPADPVDAVVRRAFDAHQRRGGRLGPEGATCAQALAEARGLPVRRLSTPWRLDAADGPDESALIARLLRDRAEAAVEESEHTGDTGSEQIRSWLRRRLDQVDAGRLTLRIDHADLLIGGACGT